MNFWRVLEQYFEVLHCNEIEHEVYHHVSSSIIDIHHRSCIQSESYVQYMHEYRGRAGPANRGSRCMQHVHAVGGRDAPRNHPPSRPSETDACGPTRGMAQKWTEVDRSGSKRGGSRSGPEVTYFKSTSDVSLSPAGVGFGGSGPTFTYEFTVITVITSVLQVVVCGDGHLC